MSKIAISRVETYNYALVEKEIFSMLDALGKDSLWKNDPTVLLKPNLLAEQDPFFAVTTNPAVVKATEKWLRSKGVTNIILADSPGGSLTLMPGFSFDSLYEKTGFSALENEIKLNKDGSWSTVSTPEGCKIKTFNILNAILSADVIVNIAKLKTHGFTTISFGIKNLFGCIPDIQKPAFHAKYPQIKDFSNMLLDLALTVKPAITVIDAIDIMEGNGPSYGTKRNLGFLFASDDVFSQDYFIAEKLGIDPTQVELLSSCKQRDLICKPEIIYGSEEYFKDIKPLLLPDFILADGAFSKLLCKLKEASTKISRGVIEHRPIVDTAKCTGCGFCSASCPRSAISVKEYAIIDYSRCIKCLCCNELCPNGAVYYKTEMKSKFRKDR